MVTAVRSPHGNSERGEIGIGIMLAVTFTFIVAVAIVNIFMFLYGQSVVRAALDDGVRAGSRVDAGPAVCQLRAQETIDDLIPGSLGDGIGTPTCVVSGGVLVASVTATFSSPLADGLSWTINLEARGVQEIPAAITP